MRIDRCAERSLAKEHTHPHDTPPTSKSDAAYGRKRQLPARVELQTRATARNSRHLQRRRRHARLPAPLRLAKLRCRAAHPLAFVAITKAECRREQLMNH